MRIQKIHSYRKNNNIGVSADILFKSGKKYTLFFEIQSQFSKDISYDSTPFLAAMLPIAMHTREDIEVEGTVSEKFMSNTKRIMKILTSWNYGFQPIKIHISEIKRDVKKGKHVGCFFSGGADSYYTYIKNIKSIDRLIFVHGFDIKAENTDLYSIVEKNIVKIADIQKTQLIKVKTNMREIYDLFFDWPLAHGFGVGSVSLFLRNGLKSVYVSCGLPAKKSDHHSMTPELDPLWSGEHLRVIHYGCLADKLLKLKELSKHPIVMETLRVCWVNKKNSYNCCSCEKCFRNMLGLYLCDSLHTCKSFHKSIDVEKLKITVVGKYELKYFRAILNALDQKRDSSEVRSAVAQLIKNNETTSFKQKTIGNVRSFINTIDKKYNHNRLYWFMVHRGLI